MLGKAAKLSLKASLNNTIFVSIVQNNGRLPPPPQMELGGHPGGGYSIGAGALPCATYTCLERNPFGNICFHS